MKLSHAADAMVRLERTVAAVKDRADRESTFARALSALQALADREGIPLAIVGGLAAIRYGYERFTKDIDVVVRAANLDVLTRVAPHYGIQVVWKDPDGWHKLQYQGVAIDVVPAGRKPRKDAPAPIPGPEQLGVTAGADYAGVAGWVETKLGAYRVQDQADVVQVIKVTTPADLRSIREHLDRVHPEYRRRFDELFVVAQEEIEQERGRGGSNESSAPQDI